MYTFSRRSTAKEDTEKMLNLNQHSQCTHSSIMSYLLSNWKANANARFALETVAWISAAYSIRSPRTVKPRTAKEFTAGVVLEITGAAWIFSLASVAFPLHEYLFVPPPPLPLKTFLRSSSVPGSVPKRRISTNPWIKFCSVFGFYPSMYCVEFTFCVSKAQQYFVRHRLLVLLARVAFS